MSDDGLLAWAMLWGRRLGALALLAGLAAAVVAGGIAAVGAVLDDGGSDSPEPSLTGPADETSVPTATPTATQTPTPTANDQPSRGADNESSEGATRLVVDIQVRNLSRPSRFRVTMIEAVDYWQRNADLAGYGVRPVVVPDPDDPDVVLRVTPNVTCEGNPAAVGCAPQVGTAENLPAPAVVQVEARPNARLTRRLAVHELGHVFGVGHCDEPRAYMYTDCPHSEREGERPDATNRTSPWAGDTVRVYVSTGGYVPGSARQVRGQVRQALDYYEREFDNSDLEPVTLRLVDDPYDADVRVNFSETTRICSLSRVCSDRFGVSTDADQALEWYSYARVELAVEDPRVVGWYVGNELGYILGADGPDDLPPAFRNETAADPADDWWTDD